MNLNLDFDYVITDFIDKVVMVFMLQCPVILNFTVVFTNLVDSLYSLFFQRISDIIEHVL